MLRTLVATGIVFSIGYILGVVFGFRAAVVDYVEEDADRIESLADDIYPSQEASAIQDALEEENTKRANDDPTGFQ